MYEVKKSIVNVTDALRRDICVKTGRKSEKNFFKNQICHARNLMKKNQMHTYGYPKLSSILDRWRQSVL